MNRNAFEGLCLLFLPRTTEAFGNILIKKKKRIRKTFKSTQRKRKNI